MKEIIEILFIYTSPSFLPVFTVFTVFTRLPTVFTPDFTDFTQGANKLLEDARAAPWHPVRAPRAPWYIRRPPPS